MQIVSINIPNLKSFKQISIFELKELQGNLKNFSDDAYIKLKNRILEVGFKYPFYVWYDKKNNEHYYIDGHHRKKTLIKMKEEGISIPEYYPVIEIEGKNKKEAAAELLHLNSNYGKITPKGINNFLSTFSIKHIEIKNIEIEQLSIENGKLETKEEVLKPYDKYHVLISADIKKIDTIKSILKEFYNTEGVEINECAN